MTSPFATHSIDHLSPSSCALFVASPAAWVLQYVYKKRGKVGAAAWRGSAVEHGIAHGLVYQTEEIGECANMAIAEFDKLAALSGDGRKDKERAAIRGMVEMGLGELRSYGVPTAMQHAVSLDVPDLGVPIIGYVDFLWESHGVLTDCKTLHALPSQIRTAHARQAAFYARCISDNIDARITYVTSKKVVTYKVDEPRAHVDALVAIAKTIERFLALSADPAVLASLVVPDTDSFYFNDPQTRRDVFEIWRM